MKKSIVIRGSISYDRHPKNFLDYIISTIRSWFDGEIIISTWNNQERHITEYIHENVDKIIYTEDPGEIDNHYLKHFKRQVISYLNGFNESTGDMVMVTRSDILFEKDIFRYIDSYPFFTDDFKVFEKKLLVSNMMTIRPDSNEFPNCFRVCDWYQIGYRNDICTWANILDSAMSLDTKKLNDMCGTETIWFLSVLKNKFGDVVDIYNPSDEIKKYAWGAIMNNFIVMDARSSLCTENLNWTFQPEYGESYFSEDLYKQLYGSIQL
jgi:hypothetical protein